MTEPEWKAELLEDRTTPLAPLRSRAAGAPVDRRWRTAAIGTAVALAISLIVLYPPYARNVASVSATPSPSPITAGTIPSAGPTAVPTPDEGPCRTDPIHIDTPNEPIADSRALVPAGALAALVVDDDGNTGTLVVAGRSGPGGQVVATYRTDPLRGNAYVGPIAWSSSGTTLLVRADQSGSSDGTGCSNLFLVNADGSGVRAFTDFGPGTSINDAALAPNSGLVAYSTPDEVRVIDPNVGERRVAGCSAAWQFRWSPDEQKLLGICNDRDLLVVDARARTAAQATMPDGLDFLAAIWNHDGSSITLVATTSGPSQGAPLTVLDFSPATLTFAQRARLSLPTSTLGFATISPSGRWMVLQDTQDGASTAVMDVATGATTALPKAPTPESYGGVPYAWESDGDTGLYAEGGVLYAVNLATATLTEVGKMPPSWFVWRSAPAP